MNVYFFLLVQTVDLSPGLLPITVGSLYIFLYFIFHSLHFFFYFATYSTISVSILITNVLNWASDMLAISSSLCCIFFLEFWSVLSFGPFFLSWHTCYVVRGRALGICQGRATQVTVLWHCMWVRGQRGNNAACSLSASFQSLPLLPTSKLGPSGADSQVGSLVYILGPCGSLQQTLLWGWDFLLPPQPPQVFSIRGFEALFYLSGNLGCSLSCSLVVPPSLSADKCETPHSASRHLARSPLHPAAHLCPSYWSGWMCLL